MTPDTILDATKTYAELLADVQPRIIKTKEDYEEFAPILDVLMKHFETLNPQQRHLLELLEFLRDRYCF